MNPSQRINLAASRIAWWAAQNPMAVRLALIALPLVAALVALLTHNPAYACPNAGSSCGTGG
jgi:hypothetical protein